MTLTDYIIILVQCMTINSIPLWDRAELSCYYSKGPRVTAEVLDRELNIDPSCNKGELEWSYSESLVTLHFERSKTFRVCFQSPYQLGMEKYDVFDTTFDGDVYMGSPYDENDVCVPSTASGNLSVTLQPRELYYGLLVKFKVICDSYDTLYSPQSTQ